MLTKPTARRLAREARAGAPLARARHRDHQPRSDDGASWSASRSRSRRARRPTCRSRTATPARRAAATRRTCSRASSPGSRTQRKPKVGQNTKYDRHVFANYGIAARGVAHDTLLAVLRAGEPPAPRHGRARQRASRREDAHLRRRDRQGRAARSRFDQVDIERATEYAAEDADVTLQLHRALWPQIEGDAKLKHIYATIEIPVLRGAARDGAQRRAASTPRCSTRQGQELDAKMLELESAAHDAGRAAVQPRLAQADPARSSSTG